MYMSQLNLNIFPEFARELEEYMGLRGLSQKSAAIRLAVREALTNAQQNKQKKINFDSLIGEGISPGLKKNPKFKSEDDLWS